MVGIPWAKIGDGWRKEDVLISTTWNTTHQQPSPSIAEHFRGFPSMPGWWFQPLWKNMSSSVGIIIPNIWQKKCSKPPTRCFCMFLAGFLLVISATMSGNQPVNLKTRGDPEHVHSLESVGDTACAFSDIFAPFGFVGHWGPWNYQRILVNLHNFPLWNSSMTSNWANSMPFSPYLSLKTPSCGLLLGCSEGVSTSLQPSAKL